MSRTNYSCHINLSSQILLNYLSNKKYKKLSKSNWLTIDNIRKYIQVLYYINIYTKCRIKTWMWIKVVTLYLWMSYKRLWYKIKQYKKQHTRQNITWRCRLVLYYFYPLFPLYFVPLYLSYSIDIVNDIERTAGACELNWKYKLEIIDAL